MFSFIKNLFTGVQAIEILMCDKLVWVKNSKSAKRILHLCPNVKNSVEFITPAWGIRSVRNTVQQSFQTNVHKYRFYPKYWDTLIPHHTCPKIWICPFYCIKTAGVVANSVDTDQTPRYKTFTSCSTYLSLKFSLLIDVKMPTIVDVLYLLAEQFSCSTMFSKKEFEIVRDLRFISRKKFMLSWVEHEIRLITSGPVPSQLWSRNALLQIYKPNREKLSLLTYEPNRDQPAHPYSLISLRCRDQTAWTRRLIWIFAGRIRTKVRLLTLWLIS